MLDSFLVRNFRLFKELKIDRLSRVNLFVGRNNTGKSCLLEAFQVYAANANPSSLWEIVSARDETWEVDRASEDEQTPQESEHPLRHLFHGYHFPEPGKNSIELGPVNIEVNQVKIHTRHYQLTMVDEGRRLRVPVTEQEVLDGVTDVELALELEEGGKNRYLLSLDGGPKEFRRRFLPSSFEPKYNLQIVPTDSLRSHKLTMLWDNINLTDLEKEVITGLQLIDGAVTGVAFVGADDVKLRRASGGRVAIIRREGSAERLPLKSMGDGMTRIFHIILALVNARNGFLLVDEFENGLHWSVHPRLWNIIFRLAEDLNVQVFVTTHSQDCIRGFHAIWKEQAEKGSFYRLDPDPDMGARVTAYHCETLSDALEMDVEVR